MFANLVPAPYFLRAADLVLNLTDVRAVRFGWAESGSRSAHVVHRDGMSEEYHGAIADALDRAFQDARALDAAALRERTNPLVAVSPTWMQPPVADAVADVSSEPCRCPSHASQSPTR